VLNTNATFINKKKITLLSNGIYVFYTFLLINVKVPLLK
jgi:hypothetical protein